MVEGIATSEDVGEFAIERIGEPDLSRCLPGTLR
jgi:hypothetical protein